MEVPLGWCKADLGTGWSELDSLAKALVGFLFWIAAGIFSGAVTFGVEFIAFAGSETPCGLFPDFAARVFLFVWSVFRLNVS